MRAKKVPIPFPWSQWAWESTPKETVDRSCLLYTSIVDDMESYSHRWPVPDVAFLVASPKLELELQTLVRVNPKIRVVIYTLEFSCLLYTSRCV